MESDLNQAVTHDPEWITEPSVTVDLRGLTPAQLAEVRALCEHRLTEIQESSRATLVQRLVDTIRAAHDDGTMPAAEQVAGVIRSLRRSGMRVSYMEQSPAEPAATPPRKARASGDAKYRNPDDHAITWSGRGKRPNWFKALVDEVGEDVAKERCAI